MTKEQKRGNKEAKKPKKVKEAPAPLATSFSGKVASIQVGAKKK